MGLIYKQIDDKAKLTEHSFDNVTFFCSCQIDSIENLFKF